MTTFPFSTGFWLGLRSGSDWQSSLKDRKHVHVSFRIISYQTKLIWLPSTPGGRSSQFYFSTSEWHGIILSAANSSLPLIPDPVNFSTKGRKSEIFYFTLNHKVLFILRILFVFQGLVMFLFENCLIIYKPQHS